MVRISTKGRYGLNAVFALAKSEDSEPFSIRQISADTKIPLQYLEQILIKLRRSGYVSSTRGAKGGYTLAKDPKDINVYKLLLTLEGEILPVHCKKGVNCSGDENTPYCCAGEIVWNKINTAVKDAIGYYTIQDLINDFEK